MLPHHLSSALEFLLTNQPRASLIAAAEELSNRYRSAARDHHPYFMTTEAHRLAYLAVRMPATFSAVQRVLQEVVNRAPNLSIRSCCDLGAGPGTATWAAAEVFPSLERALLCEKDGDLIRLGSKMMQMSQQPLLQAAEWRCADLITASQIASSDLVMLSYVVGELPLDQLNSVITKAWAATQQLLVVIEPGTHHGFQRIRQVRQQLIDSGAYLVAPCPHQGLCPMAGNDWCHFSQRLERSEWHRSVKEVSMGYEDEKFSYIVASKQPVVLPVGRIVRHPQRHSGHADFTICSNSGNLEKVTVSRRDKSLYKQVKKLEWGDVWPGKQEPFVSDIDWEAQWQAFGEDYRDGFVHLDLQKYTTQPVDAKWSSVLKLKPGPGFGDLSHPTTRLMLKMMDSIVKGQEVLDIGCGSGVLSLAALAMGASSVYGIDIDEGALKHAHENAIENKMEGQLLFELPEDYLKGNRPLPHVVLMNMIQSEQQVAWGGLSCLHGKVEKIITSGILCEDREKYLQLCASWGWRYVAELEEDGWLVFVYTQTT